jgi:CelD/BcsL family acetyltransferase involved in cellulose biosynthesis
VEIDVLRPQFLPPEMLACWRSLQGLDPAWDSPFLSPYWPQAVERAQDGVDRGLRMLVLHEGGRPVGFMSARGRQPAGMASGAPMCAYQGVVTEPDVEIDPRRLAKALGVHRFDFSHMLASQSGFAPYAKGAAAAWIVEVPGGYAAYVAERRAAGVTVIKELDKQRRKAKREAGPLVFTARSASKADLERLIELKRVGYAATDQTDIFAAGWPQRLVHGLFCGREPDFGGALFTLHIGGALAAAQFHLTGARTLHAWLTAEEEAFEPFAPGQMLFQDILRWMDETPYDRLDLGEGDDAFRRDLATARQQTLHGFVGVPSPASFVRGAAWRMRRMAESLPLGPVSALPARAMLRHDLLRGLR